MNSQKVKDLEFGFQSEDELFDFFNDNIGKCCKTPKFAIFDYEGDDFFIELKTRRINSTGWVGAGWPLEPPALEPPAARRRQLAAGGKIMRK